MSTQNHGFESWNENVALNTKTNEMVAHELQTMALNTKLRRNGGSECQTKNNSYECQAETTTLNAKLIW